MNNLFNSVVSIFTDDNPNDKQQVIELVSKLVQENGGQVSNLLAKLQQGGLGDALSSWISNGNNQSVSGEQISQALGDSNLSQIASSMGLNGTQASDLLAKFLPEIINGLTPNGTAQDTDGFGLDDIARMGMKMLMK